MKLHNNIRIPSRKHQKGVTLIEAIVFLIIGIIVLAAAAAGIGKVFGTSEIATEASNITSLITSTKTLRSSGGYGPSGTNLVTSLIATDGIPKTMAVIGGVPTNAWNGAVAIVSTGAGYTITYPNVPKAACIELATKVSRGGAVTTKVGTGTAVTGEIDTATATTRCTSDTANSIQFGMQN